MKNLLVIFICVFSFSQLSAEEISTSYANNWQMRTDRKVGAGLNVGGALGTIGAVIELNFEDENGSFAGFGQGPGYKTFALAWKHSFQGEYLTPFTTLGYSRWYSSSENGNVEDSNILKQLLSRNEILAGRFNADFVTGSFGAQYNELSGDLQGLSFYGDISLMYEYNKGSFIPLGSVGSIYYF